MSWKGESNRHRLSSKGIKTGRKWKLYHGTGQKQAKRIDKQGLRTHQPKDSFFVQPIYLTPKKEEALRYAKEGPKGKDYRYQNLHETEKRKPVIYEITLEEKDFEKEGLDSETIETRKRNLDRAFEENWPEYEYYHDIPKDKLKRLRK